MQLTKLRAIRKIRDLAFLLSIFMPATGMHAIHDAEMDKKESRGEFSFYTDFIYDSESVNYFQCFNLSENVIRAVADESKERDIMHRKDESSEEASFAETAWYSSQSDQIVSRIEPTGKRKKPAAKQTRRDIFSKIADDLVEQLAQEQQHETSKPKRERLTESESFKRWKRKIPASPNGTTLYRALIASKECISAALLHKNHSRVRKLAEDPVTRAAWYFMKNENKDNLLIIAILNSDLLSVKALVENGFDVNLPNHRDTPMNPLIAALAEGNTPIIEYLLEHGATIDTHEIKFLKAAIEGRSAFGIDLLIDAGSDYRGISWQQALKSDHTRLIDLVFASYLSEQDLVQNRDFILSNDLLKAAIAHNNAALFEKLLMYFYSDKMPTIDGLADSLLEAVKYTQQKYVTGNREKIETKNSIRIKSYSDCFRNILPVLIKNGIGANADFEAFEKKVAVENKLLVDEIRRRSASNFDVRAFPSNHATYESLLAQIEVQNAKIMPMAKKQIRKALDARHEEIALIKTEGSNLFTIPGVCALISEFESDYTFLEIGSLSQYIQSRYEKINQAKGLVEQWEACWPSWLAAADIKFPNSNKTQTSPKRLLCSEDAAYSQTKRLRKGEKADADTSECASALPAFKRRRR